MPISETPPLKKLVQAARLVAADSTTAALRAEAAALQHQLAAAVADMRARLSAADGHAFEASERARESEACCCAPAAQLRASEASAAGHLQTTEELRAQLATAQVRGVPGGGGRRQPSTRLCCSCGPPAVARVTVTGHRPPSRAARPARAQAAPSLPLNRCAAARRRRPVAARR